MLSSLRDDITVIDCLRVRERGGDPQQAQQNIGRLLANAELRPSSLPVSSILCLRTVKDPAPGAHWDLERVHPPREWQESATRELDRLAAHAVRPALAPVPPSAQAVWFLDRVELLACLTADWLQGTLRANWWWFTLLKRNDAERIVLQEWTQSPDVVPVVIASLGKRGFLTAFLTKLSDDTTEHLLESVRRTFAVPHADPTPETDLVPTFDEPGIKPRLGFIAEKHEIVGGISGLIVEQQPTNKSALRSSNQNAKVRKISPVEPWLPIVPEASTPRLSIRKRILVAQALMLHRAPARARAVAFQQELVEWETWAEAHPDLSAAVSDPPDVPRFQAAAKPVPRAAVHVVAPKPSGQSSVEGSAAITLDSLPPPGVAFETDNPSISQVTAQTETLRSTLESSFAGVLFLLNVALFLKLYADFTSPRTLGLELNIWDFLCLVGSEFAGNEIQKDGLSVLLAMMAGRDKLDPPGAYFKPPSEWILPESWLDSFPEHFERKEVIRDGRCQVLHPAGFVISDTAVLGHLDERLSRWVNWISSYIRARLARAVGRDDAVETLCRIPGHIRYTSTRVDVFYSLESYPIEIRLAGLDRDPGWIPAAGRYVAYHFQ